MSDWQLVMFAPRHEYVRIKGWKEVAPDKAVTVEGDGKLSNIGWVTDLDVDVITHWKPGDTQ